MAIGVVDEEILSQDPVLAEIVKRLVEAFEPESIYLFGSKARGDDGPDSDYDLMVVVSDSPLPRFRREQKAFRALRGVGASKDVVVLTRNEFDTKKKVVCSLPATVLREGRIIHGF